MTGHRAAALAALAGSLVLLLAVLAPWKDDERRYRAVFDAVPGLVEGGDVRIGGVDVGEVEAIRLERERPVVTLRLDEGVRLRRGARADLRLGSLSGEFNRSISLDPGRGPELPEGATLGLGETDQPVEVDDVLSTLDPATRREARELLDGLALGTRGTGPAIETALRRSSRALRATSDVLAAATADDQALRDLVTATRHTTQAVAGAPGAAAGAIDEVRRLLTDVASRSSDLGAGIAALPGGLRSARGALRAVRAGVPELRGLVADAGPGVRELRAAAPELRHLLTAARPALADASVLVRRAPRRLRAIAPLLPVAGDLLGRLDPMLRRAAPVLDESRARLPDFFSFFANWADFTSNYDANGHGARVGIVIPPAPLQPVGPDEQRAGQLRAPFVRTPGVLEGEPWTDYRGADAGDGG